MNHGFWMVAFSFASIKLGAEPSAKIFPREMSEETKQMRYEQYESQNQETEG